MNQLLVNSYFDPACAYTDLLDPGLESKKRSLPLHKSSQNKQMQDHIQKYYIGVGPPGDDDMIPRLSVLLRDVLLSPSKKPMTDISDSPLISTGYINYQGLKTPNYLVSPDEKQGDQKLAQKIDNLRVQKLFANETELPIFNDLITQKEPTPRKDSINIAQKRTGAIDKLTEDSQKFNICNANVIKFNDFKIHQNFKLEDQEIDTKLQSQISHQKKSKKRPFEVLFEQ